MEDVLPTQEQVRDAYALAGPCRLCPRHCGVMRESGETGYCGVGAAPLVASAAPHFGEERVLVGLGGSGTIFLSGCNMLCVFCQNYDISHGLEGKANRVEDVTRCMLALARSGCVNINFVTPTHVAPWLMDALRRARQQGLELPVVWNCGGYESVDVLRLLDGAVQIYMPDVKFYSSELAARYAEAPDYPVHARAALAEMYRQVGNLRVEHGVAVGGLLVRHLVMPGGGKDSRAVMDMVADVAPGAAINVMDQYRPLYRAHECPEINRSVNPAEVGRVRGYAMQLGLKVL